MRVEPQKKWKTSPDLWDLEPLSLCEPWAPRSSGRYSALCLKTSDSAYIVHLTKWVEEGAPSGRV